MRARWLVPALSLAIAWWAVAPAAAAAEVTPSQVTEAAKTLSGCVQDRARLLVLFMVDESGSLGKTDHRNRRVEGLKVALAGFARLAEAPLGGRRPDIRVMLSGFSGVVDPDPEADESEREWEWDKLDDATLGGLLDKAEEFRSRNRGRDTDYAIALGAAQRMLAEEAAVQTRHGGAPPCRALVWFTDGQYKITDHVGRFADLRQHVPYAPEVDLRVAGGGERAVAAGRRHLCGRGGLMDDLARDEIVKFTVALSSSISAPNRDFLRGLSDGSAGCGSRLSPATGTYLEAVKTDCLFFIFGSLLGGPGCPTEPAPVCQSDRCKGASTFRTIPGVSRFLITAGTGADGIGLRLSGPSGRTIVLAPHRTQTHRLDGATIEPRWLSGQNVVIEADLSGETGGRWVGEWTYGFAGSANAAATARPLSTVQLFTDMTPRLTDEPALIRGETVNLELMLGRPDGSAATAGPLVDAASMEARVLDVNLGRTETIRADALGGGLFDAAVAVDRKSRARTARLDMTATFEPVGSVVVEPTTRSVSLDVELPEGAGFPEVEPGRLELGSIAGKGSTSMTLVVRASPKSSGAIWLGRPRIDGPADAGGVSFSSAPDLKSHRTRLVLRRGETQRIRVTFAPRAEAVGRVRVSLPVRLTSDLVERSETTELEGGFDLYPEPDVGFRLAIVLLLMAAGIAVPLLLLYAINYLGARLAAPQELLVWSQHVTIDLSGDEPMTIVASQSSFHPLSSVGADQQERRLVVTPDTGTVAIELRAVAARRFSDLFSGPYGVASAESGTVYAGGTPGLRSWEDGRLHEVPLGLIGTWLFVPEYVTADLDGDGPPTAVSGQLALISGYEKSWDAGPELAGQAESALQLRDWEAWKPGPARDEDEAVGEDEDEDDGKIDDDGGADLEAGPPDDHERFL